MLEAPYHQSFRGEFPFWLILDKADKLPLLDMGGGEYPHAGGTNVDNGGILALMRGAAHAIVGTDGEQDWHVVGESFGRSFFVGLGHGVLVHYFGGSELNASFRH